VAEAGANVAGVDVRDTSDTMTAVEGMGRRAFGYQADVSNLRDMEVFASEVVKCFGGIDGWVNDAGVIVAKPFLEISEKTWQEIMSINLGGYINGCRVAIPHMVKNGNGSIVNVSSVTDMQPVANLSAYVTSKGGIVALTKALALEFASQGIRVNAVAPGAVETDLNADVYTDEVRANYRSRIPAGRIAEPEDITGAVVFLLSDASRYITGVELLIDGGLVLNGNVGHRVS
jgi:3-oxoacyl-[acyl-carrier protein] reductase